MTGKLTHYRILILETREEAQFSKLLVEQGADVLQCPMFKIDDATDPAPVEAWIERYIRDPFDEFVLTTGEGLRRLMKVARRNAIDGKFIAAIGKSRTIARGPKPVRALREIGLDVHHVTDKPTSEGIAETMAALDLQGHRTGLQLYPDKDHSELIASISRGGASVDPVLPYIYDPQAAESSIVTAISEMANGAIDSIALTSSGQVRRLFDVARAHQCEETLRKGLTQTTVASVGPVVSDELAARGIHANIAPADGAFFMRPLINAMAATLNQRPPRRTVTP